MSENVKELPVELPDVEEPKSAGPESTEQPKRGGSGIIFAVLLIAGGGLLLLNNLGITSINLLGLLQFWPVLLVLVGLDMIVGRRSPAASIGMGLLALMIVGGLIFYTQVTNVTSIGTVSGNFAEPVAGLDRLDVTLDLGITDAEISALDGSQAFDGRYTMPGGLEIIDSYRVAGDTGYLDIKQQGETAGTFGFNTNTSFDDWRFDLGLTDEIPVALDIHAGVGRTVLDLSGMDITTLSFDGGVGDAEIILPGRGEFDFSLNMGIGSVLVIIPDDMDARVTFDGGITDFDISQRFSENGSAWETEGYGRGPNNILINIDAGIGSVSIR